MNQSWRISLILVLSEYPSDYRTKYGSMAGLHYTTPGNAGFITGLYVILFLIILAIVRNWSPGRWVDYRQLGIHWVDSAQQRRKIIALL